MDMKHPAPAEELLSSGHFACPGCGVALSMRLTLKVLGERTRMVVPASCSSVIASKYPHTAMKVPFIHTPFAVSAGFATGIAHALELKSDKESPVMVWAGDGASYDIGFAGLSGAAERNERILYICYDNEAYMNTGAQRSSATPSCTWTPTTPSLKREQKKNLFKIMVDHKIKYAATACVSHTQDMMEKLKKAKEASKEGFSFLLLLTPCPTGWGMEENLTVQAARLAVETGIFPLLEAEKGRVRITHIPTALGEEERYLKLQKRFSKMGSEETKALKEWVRERWRELDSLSSSLP